jgi:hypothetical protein
MKINFYSSLSAVSGMYVYVSIMLSDPYVLRVGAYIGIISRHMTVGPFQSSPSGR